MNIKSLFLIIIITLLLAEISCKTTTPPPPLPSPPPPNAQILEKCGLAGDHLRELGCPEGQPLEDGTAWETFCISTETEGSDLDLDCLMQIRSCEEINSICRR